MDRKECRPFKEKLLAHRSRVNDYLQARTSRAASESSGNANQGIGRNVIPPAASERDDDARIDLLETESRVLNQIERALERVEDGVYGHCQQCGRRISKTRLRAVPYAENCMRCASQRREAR